MVRFVSSGPFEFTYSKSYLIENDIYASALLIFISSDVTNILGNNLMIETIF